MNFSRLRADLLGMHNSEERESKEGCRGEHFIIITLDENKLE